MKKIVLVTVFSLIIGTTSLSAVGIGIQGGINVGPSTGGGLSVTFKLNNPWVFAVNLSLGDSIGVGVSADQWVLNNTIVGPLKWFVGWGLYGNLVIGDNFGFGGGARIPLGLNMYFANGFIEPYIQLAVGLGVSFFDNLSFDWSIPINLGIRFWL